MDLETFNIVSQIFTSKERTRYQKNGEIPLFSKKVYCSCCGKAFNKNNAHVKVETKDRGNTTDNGYICDGTLSSIEFNIIKSSNTIEIERLNNKLSNMNFYN